MSVYYFKSGDYERVMRKLVWMFYRLYPFILLDKRKGLAKHVKVHTYKKIYKKYFKKMFLYN